MKTLDEMSALWRDFRRSLLVLLRQPTVVGTAIASLALAIGVNSAIFSIINVVFLRPLPVHDPGRLVSISTVRSDRPDAKESLSLSMFEEIEKRSRVFAGLFVWDDSALRNMEANGVKYPGGVVRVSGDYFSTLGIKPFMGRLIKADDVAISTATSVRIAVLDYRCWQQRFNRDPQVLGKVLWVDGVPLTIVGVAPESFLGLNIDGPSDAFVPIGFAGTAPKGGRVQVTARLKPQVTLKQAGAHLRSIWPEVLKATIPARLQDTKRERYLARHVVLESAATGSSYLRGELSRPLAGLMGLAGVVLLIACVNLANLMLARAVARRHELGIRVALGASTWALARLITVESLLFSTVGSAMGLAGAFGISRALLINLMTWQSSYSPLTFDPSPDVRVFGFTAAIAVFTGVFCALAPVWRIIRSDPADALRNSSRTARGGGGGFRKLLVTVQVALSLVLMIAAIQFARSIQKMRALDPGFRREGVLTMGLFPQVGREKIPNRTAYYREVVDKLSQIPGVQAASYSLPPPLSGVEFKVPVSAPHSGIVTEAVQQWAGPGFFRTVEMRVMAGREFDWRDDDRFPKVAIISESLARRLFGQVDSVGQTIRIGDKPDDIAHQIIGVVNSASLCRLQSHEPMAVYTAMMQAPLLNQPDIQIRTTAAFATVQPSAARVLESLGHHYSVQSQSLETRAELLLSPERLIFKLASCFALFTVFLASLGLYALMSHAVATRTFEIGMRMALGAQRQTILVMIIREAAWLVIVGVVIGIPAAVTSMRMTSDMLFGVTPQDPLAIVASAAVLAIVTLSAAYLPARRAAQMDPLTALRYE